tara:strand:- start:4670 stop:5032 length:363 start_codon:yes stop_codon:yes gene_type:complete
MPTYTSSPFRTDLQSYLFKGLDVDNVGSRNCIGAPASIYTLHISNGDAGDRYVAFWDVFDGATPTWDTQECLIRIQASTDMTIYIDKGIPFDTEISIAASQANDGTGSPTDLDVDIFATP